MMVLNTEWTQLEIIELLNELPSQNLDDVSTSKGPSSGNGGFGFGITGNKSTGVVVKVITPGGSASKDGRLKINDQLFQIGSINVRGMNSEQVAAVLRQSAFHGQFVKFLVARPINNSIDDFEKIVSNEAIDLDQEKSNNDIMNVDLPLSKGKRFYIKTSAIVDKKINFMILNQLEPQDKSNEKLDSINNMSKEHHQEVESKNISNIEEKDTNSKNSTEILIGNDYIIEIPKKNDFDNTKNLFSNINKILKTIGLSIGKINEYFFVESLETLEPEFQMCEIYDQLLEINTKNINEFSNDTVLDDDKINFKFSKNFQLKVQILQKKWYNYLTNEQDDFENYLDLKKFDLEIIVSRIDKTKSKNLGITLEGTVDLDDNGNEKYPHHYIRSIMTNGPVNNSKDAKFQEGDELLEIDSIKLYAVNYVELLQHLKSLKNKSMILVCARKISKISSETFDFRTEIFAFEKEQNIKDEELEKNTVQIRAKSETRPIEIQQEREAAKKNLGKNSFNPNRLYFRSRSLELTGPKLWDSKTFFIDLIKGENGLGFSLIDYQNDPYNPLSKTMIAFRALVPGGVAHLDGRIMPGQRLVSINDYVLDNSLFLKNKENKIISSFSVEKKNSFPTSCSKIFNLNLLDFALNILKSIPIGKEVRLGIQNPLPYPDADNQSVQSQDGNSNSLNTMYDLVDSNNCNTTKIVKTINQNCYEDLFLKTDPYKNFNNEFKSNFDFNSEKKELNKSEADLTNFGKSYKLGKKFKNKIQYGSLATSAPAILSYGNCENDKYFKFYSSMLQLKLNTLNFFKFKFKSIPNLKLKSNAECASSKIDGFECLESDYKKKSKSENFIKDRSISVSFPLNVNFDEKHDCQIQENLFRKSAYSIKFLNSLLIEDQHNVPEISQTESYHELLNENQFHQAFIKNINKNTSHLCKTNEKENANIDMEILEIEEILKNFIACETNNKKIVSDLNTDVFNIKYESKFHLNNLVNENIFDALEKISLDMAFHSWPKITVKPINKNLSELKKQINRRSDIKRSSCKRKNTFDEQIVVINQSRSPSGARYIRNFPDNSNHSRSKSQGSYPQSINLLLEKDSISKINSKFLNKIKIINILGKEIVRLPWYLEKEIRIKKDFYPLGILSVDCSVDEGINGCVIKRIESNSACAKDGRLKIGDFLLSVNNEQMRICTNSNARAILNRASLTSKDVVIIYIRLEDALKFKSKIKLSEKNIVSTLSTSFINSNLVRSPSSKSKSQSVSLHLSNSSISGSLCTSKSISLDSVFSFPKFYNDFKSTEFQLKKANAKLKSEKSMKKYDEKIIDETLNLKSSNESDIVKDMRNDHCEKTVSTIVSQLGDQQSNKMNQSDSFVQTDFGKTLWGSERVVIIEREENQSLGISIVGGKLDVSTQKGTNLQHNFITGIFVKHVQELSPAGKNGMIKTGDRILSVNEVDLTQASHDQAVAVIKNSKSPVKFLIQSLIHKDPHTESVDKSFSLSTKENHHINDSDKFDSNQIENKYNYSLETIKEKYNYLLETTSNDLEKGELCIFHLRKNYPNENLGISLSGNVNLNKTSVFVCGISSNSIAQKSGLKIGDQILEINGQLIYGRAHSNAAPLIKNIKSLEIFLVIYRNEENLKQMFKSPLSLNSINSNSHKSINDKLLMSEVSEVLKLESFSNSESYRSSISAENSESMLSSSSQINCIEKNNYKSNFNEDIQKIKLKRESNEKSFGIVIGEKNERLIVRELNKNGIAFRDGRLEIGDEILAVNNLKIDTINYNYLTNFLLSSNETVELEVLKKNTSKNLQSEPEIIESTNCEHNETSSQFINENPKTNAIIVGQETWIEIDRKKNGLGLSIVGGCDTQIQGIIIHDIYKNGAAFNDKRLLIGDQILKVNNIDLMSLTHEQALNALRQTFESVKLLIHRSSSQNQNILQKKNRNNFDVINNDYNEKFMDVKNIELNKKFGKGLGFSIIGQKDGTGVFISHIIDGGCAHRDGRLAIGDLILEVNNQDIQKSAYNDVAFLLKTLPQGKVNLKIGRFKTVNNRPNDNLKTSPDESIKYSRRNSKSILYN